MFAYLDPGSGALFWQLLLSTCAGILLLIGRVREKLQALFRWVAGLFLRKPPA